MYVRSFLFAAIMGVIVPAICVAAEPRATSDICSGTPPSNWLIDTNQGGEYSEIKPGKTTMKLHVHLHPNVPDEWQIEFSNPPSMKPPPGADVVHLIKVCWKDRTDTVLARYTPPAKSAPINPYLIYAYKNILTKKSNYFIGTGYLDGEPTMAVIALSQPTTGAKMGLTLVLIKLDERTASPGTRQGGVIHGQEN